MRAEIGLFLQLVGACGLVFARPILDAFGRSPETFVEADAGWKAITLFGVLWVVVPPVVLWILTFATGVFGPRVRRIAHVVVLAALAAVFTAAGTVPGAGLARRARVAPRRGGRGRDGGALGAVRSVA